MAPMAKVLSSNRDPVIEVEATFPPNIAAIREGVLAHKDNGLTGITKREYPIKIQVGPWILIGRSAWYIQMMACRHLDYEKNPYWFPRGTRQRGPFSGFRGTGYG